MASQGALGPVDKKKRQENLDLLAVEIDDALGCVEIEPRARDGVAVGYRDTLLPFSQAQRRLQAIVSKLDDLEESDDLHVRKVLGQWALRIRSLRYYARMRTQKNIGFRSEWGTWPDQCAACRADVSWTETIDVAAIVREELEQLEPRELEKRARADAEQLRQARGADNPTAVLIELVMERELGTWHLRSSKGGPCVRCDRAARAVGGARGDGRECLTSHFALLGQHNVGRRCAVSGEMVSDAGGASFGEGPALTKQQCQTVVDAVTTNILFKDLTAELTSLSWHEHDLFKCLTLAKIKKGTVIIKQGEDGEKVKFFYIIDSGACKVEVDDIGVVTTLGTKPGQDRSFGELALMYQSPRAATVTATADTAVWQMDRESFHKLLVNRASEKLKSWESFVIDSVPLLKPLQKSERQRFTEGTDFEKQYAKGAVITQEGAVAEHMYVLVSGEVAVWKDNKTVAVLDTVGGFLGEAEMLSSWKDRKIKLTDLILDAKTSSGTTRTKYHKGEVNLRLSKMNVANLCKEADDANVAEAQLQLIQTGGTKRTATIRAKTDEVKLLCIDRDMFSDICDNPECLEMLQEQVKSYRDGGVERKRVTITDHPSLTAHHMIPPRHKSIVVGAQLMAHSTFSDTEDTDSRASRCWRNSNIHPNANWKSFWDVLMLVLVLYSSVMEPFKAAFELAPTMQWWDWWVDGMFYADLLINFNTGVEEPPYIIMDKGKIIKNYLGGWFWVDIVATVEWDIIAASIWDLDRQAQQMMRLVRLMRTLRLAKASRLIFRLTKRVTLNTGFIESLKWVIYELVIAHLLACIFYLVPAILGNPELCYEASVEHSLEGDTVFFVNVTDSSFGTLVDIQDDTAKCAYRQQTPCVLCTIPDSWRDVASSDGDGALFIPSPGAHGDYGYVEAFYWSITTMTTIGYGDISPKTDAEIWFTIFAEMLGMGFFALLVTQINKLKDILSAEEDATNERKNSVIKWCQDHKITPALMDRVITYLNYRVMVHERNSFDAKFFKDVQLSDELTNELKVELYFKWLEIIPLLAGTRAGTLGGLKREELHEDLLKQAGGENAPEELFGALALKIKTHCYASTDEIIGPHKEYHDEDGAHSSSGAYGERLYIIVSGVAEIVTDYTTKSGEKKWRPVGRGYVQGIIEQQSGKEHDPSIGLDAMLDPSAFKAVLNKHDIKDDPRSEWVVRPHDGDYVDTAYIERADVLECIRSLWDSGEDALEEWSREKLDQALEEQKRVSTPKAGNAEPGDCSKDAAGMDLEPEPETEPNAADKGLDKLAGALLLNRVKNRFRARSRSAANLSEGSEIPIVVQETQELLHSSPKKISFAGLMGGSSLPKPALLAAAAQEPASTEVASRVAALEGKVDTNHRELLARMDSVVEMLRQMPAVAASPASLARALTQPDAKDASARAADRPGASLAVLSQGSKPSERPKTATVAPKPAAAHKATRPVTPEATGVSPESVAVIPSEEHERLAEEAKLAGNELM